MRKILLLCSCLLLNSCKKPFNCSEAEGLEDSAMVIYPFHTGLNEYFYPEDEFRSPYKRDSLQIFNEDSRRFERVSFLLKSDPTNPLKGFYAILLAPAFIIPDDNDAYQREKVRKIYLKYNHNTADTLLLIFKAYKDECKKGVYEYLKVYHRGNLVFSASDNTSADFKLNH
jgi:hypothetical protein